MRLPPVSHAPGKSDPDDPGDSGKDRIYPIQVRSEYIHQWRNWKNGQFCYGPDDPRQMKLFDKAA
jgi:hypothetical protein